jgi:hypothetical protein
MLAPATERIAAGYPWSLIYINELMNKKCKKIIIFKE